MLSSKMTVLQCLALDCTVPVTETEELLFIHIDMSQISCNEMVLLVTRMFFCIIVESKDVLLHDIS